MRPTPFIIGSLLAAMSFASVAHDHADHDHDEHGQDEHAHEEHDHDHDHGSLAAHEHGVGSLNLVVDGDEVTIELDSPADNLLGFEYLPTTDADKAKVKALRAQLTDAEALFVFPAAAGCSVEEVELDSPLFDAVADEHEHEHEHAEKSSEAHSDIQAHFHFTCTQAAELDQIQVALFSAFPGTERLLLQAIGPKGQQGGELTAAQNLIRF